MPISSSDYISLYKFLCLRGFGAQRRGVVLGPAASRLSLRAPHRQVRSHPAISSGRGVTLHGAMSLSQEPEAELPHFRLIGLITSIWRNFQRRQPLAAFGWITGSKLLSLALHCIAQVVAPCNDLVSSPQPRRHGATQFDTWTQVPRCCGASFWARCLCACKAGPRPSWSLGALRALRCFESFPRSSTKTYSCCQWRMRPSQLECPVWMAEDEISTRRGSLQ